MNIYEHFSCYTILPVKLSHIRDHILETGLVSKIIRVPVDLNHYIIHGGYHLYRDLAPYASNQVVARIGYPRIASIGMQRLVCVKEMLHVLDAHEATSPTKAAVNRLIDDLLLEPAATTMGIPATVDRHALLHALCFLLPRDALDILRPLYKGGAITVEQVAEKALVPVGFAQVALSDTWRNVADAIK